MAAGRVYLSSAIFYIFFGLYSHQLFYKSLSNNADISNIDKSNFPVKFSSQHFVIGYLNQYFTTPRVHGWNCSRTKRKFLSARTYFYRNSVASFNLTRLSLSGDVNPNPGPIATANSKPKCSICSRTIARNHRSVVCTTCKSSLHIKCCGLSVANYKQIHLGVCKTRTGYLRMADGGCGWENADRKMRMEKMRITKKVRGKKREMRMAKKH